MKHKNLCKTIISFFLLAIFSFFSANIMAQPLFADNHTMQAPDVWSFMKYGNNSVNLYTGTIQVSIPIYTYEDNDFVIPVSLDYSSNGFIPNMPTGSVGLGWMLNASGMITREIRGVADEYRTVSTLKKPASDKANAEYKYYPQSILNGYYSYYLKMRESNPDQRFKDVKERIEGTSAGLFHPIEFDGNNDYRLSEVSPDIFSFNFMGHKGKFSMFEGDIYVYDTDTPRGEYQIDLSGLRNACSEIKVITGDGYKYTFGGLDDKNSIEIKGRFTPFLYKENIDLEMRDQINSAYTCWFLTSIEAPNGRKVIFKYSGFTEIKRTFPGGVFALDIITAHLDPTTWIIGTTSQATKTSAGIFEYTYKERQLTQIDIGNGLTIDFSYSLPQKERSVDVYLYYADPESSITFSNLEFMQTTITPKISTIKVNNKFDGVSSEIKSATLQYCTMGTGDGYKHFLASVDFSGEGSYRMYYHGADEGEPDDELVNTISTTSYSDIPANGTSAIDYWGFYNGRINPIWYNASDMSTSQFSKIDTKQHLNISERMPDYESSMFGMLKILVYPTSGCTSFEYESNDASQYVKCGSNVGYSNYKLGSYALTTKNNTTTNKVGGVRIKRISDYTASVNSIPKKTREFFYEAEDGSSSGIVLYFPVQTMFYQLRNTDTNQYKQCSLLSSYSLSSNTNSSHIGYSRVVEKNSDNSYVEYKFTDYAEYPDDTAQYEESESGALEFINQTPADLIKFLRDPISNEMNRGRLRSKTLYSANNNPVYSEHYVFDNLRSLKYIYDVRHAIASYYEHRILTERYPILKKEVVNHMSNGKIKTTYTYDYNSLGQKIKEETYGPQESYNTTYTYYAHETNTAIKNCNLLTVPRQVVNTVKKSSYGDETVIEDIKYSYNAYKNVNNANFYKISKIEKALAPQLLTQPRTFYTYATYNDYDYYGNLLETTNQEGVKTSYIWGYGGMYPVVFAENASRTQLQNILGSSMVSRSPISGYISESLANALRSISCSSIKTYTYKPFIGIKTITDPSGRRIEYEYYQDGKLQLIKDDKGNVISEYEYHFIGH